MKRNARIQLVILLGLGGAVILTMLLPRISARRRTALPVEVSVILREEDSALWSSFRLGMEQAAGELGAELRLLTLARADDGRDQLDILRREVERRTGALVVIPADPVGLDRALAEKGVGCPLVCVESSMDQADLVAPPDNEALGRDLARAVLEDGIEGIVLLLNASPDSTGVSARFTAARGVLEEAGVPVRCREEADLGGEGLRDLLKQPDLAAVVTFEPALTQQAAALKDSLELTVPLYGTGGSPGAAAWMEKGVITAAAVWSDFAAGYLAVEGAVSLARGENYQMVPLPTYIVREENLHEPEYQKLLFPVG